MSNHQAVLITGASTGIGKACALHLDALGMTVFAGVRNEHALQDLAKQSSKRLHPIYLDVTQSESIEKAYDIISQHNPTTLHLINNAGIVLSGPLESIDLNRFRHQYEVNVFGVLNLIQIFLPLIRKHKGRIINMSSVGGRTITPYFGACGSSKFALEAMSDALRFELARSNIPVIVIQPGSIWTPIWHKLVYQAESNIDALPDDLQAIYKGDYDHARQLAGWLGIQGVMVEKVASKVQTALQSKRPRSRYVVGGWHAYAIILFGMLPDVIRDILFRFAFSKSNRLPYRL